jgi:uncharacterized protein (TIGR02598 family)
MIRTDISHITRQEGFSLPEVTIAVGIAALGLVALLGLMPQGLEMARKTGELAAQREIVEQIARDLEQTSWKDLDTMANGTGVYRFFDEQGVEVDQGSFNTSYVANVRVSAISMAQLPQGGGRSRDENFLRRMQVRIATTTNQNYAFDDPRNISNFATFHSYVAKSR